MPMPSNDYANYDVVLLPTFLQVEWWRKKQALAHAGGLFGPTVTTFNAWIADLWELHGDGRALVDSVQRAMVMRAAFAQIAERAEPDPEAAAPQDGPEGDLFAQQDGMHVDEPVADDVLTLTPGLSEMACRCETRAAGVVEYDNAVHMADEGVTAPGFSVREQLFLRGIAHYRHLLRKLGLVEPGEACRLLALDAAETFPRPLRVLVDDAAPLDWRMQRFFEACPLDVQVNPADGADGIHRLQEGVQPLFAFPSGRYATPALVMQLLDMLQPGEQAVVASADPLALYRQLEPALARKGLVGSVQGQAEFGRTDFGRAYLLACQVMHDEVFDPSALADIVRSPFSGFGAARAREVDAQLRADRLADRQDWIDRLSQESEDFAMLVGMTVANGFQQAAAHFAAKVHDIPGRSPAWRSEQLTVLDGLCAVRQAADVLGADWRDCQAVLERLVVSVPYAGASGGVQQPTVLVTTQGAAARLGAGSHAMLVAADLTTDSYPLADADDVAATLFGKLGLPPVEDALGRARRTFAALMKVPTRLFVCLRPLNDADGNPAYACAMLQEFVDAYRQGSAGDGGSCDPDDLPADLAAGLLQRGEELLFANSQAADASSLQAVASTVALRDPGLQGEASPDELLLPRRFPDGQAPLLQSPSPSQIELYLECPYKWFTMRRLGLERLEEGFGPLEKGTFAHAVLERFYRRFQQECAPKVTKANLPTARRILLDEADAIQREMLAADPGSGRLVPATVLEEHQIAQLKRQLADYLDYECELLPTFHPAYFEYAFAAEDAPEYAGCRMVGTVDRIDVDDAGHAVIIDYKGSVNGEHDIAGKDASHAGKVQARIYAQLVKRELGLDVVGTLYVSYGKRHAAAGALDGRAIEVPHVPGIHREGPWCAPNDADPNAVAGFAELSFTQMLDATEQLVQQAIAGMRRGDVRPCPATPDACKYCDVAQCPMREA